MAALAVAGVMGCGSDGSTGPKSSQFPSTVHLQSDPGDYIGKGRSYDYTPSNAELVLSASGGYLSISVRGDEDWYGEFQAPSGVNRLQRATYTNVHRYPGAPATGGLDWSGEGRGCNTLSGAFTVEDVTYDNGALTAIDLSFEQHCEGGSSALRGTIHWRADDPTHPPGPVNPIPSSLWQPSIGSTPQSGNYVYLVSDFGDYVGAGDTYTYTPTNSVIGVTASGGHLAVEVDGTQWWLGDFQTMSTHSQLEVGYYPDLRRYPFHNPVKGGLDWGGQGRGCNTLRGWFAIDAVTYTNGSLTAIELRFEQHCEEGTPALRGAIHWRP